MVRSIEVLPDDVERELRDHGDRDRLERSVAIAAAEGEVMRAQMFADAAWELARGPQHPLSRAGIQRQAVAANNRLGFAQLRLRYLRAAEARVAA